MTERGETLFVVTYGDMALLPEWQFDTIWRALGVIVEARVKALRTADALPVMKPFEYTQPRPRDNPEAIFAAIRASNTYGEAALLLEWDGSALYGHLDVMEGHGELPDDILEWRRGRSFAAKSREEQEAILAKGSGPTWPPSDPATVADVYAWDKTLVGTANRLGISVSTVRRRLAEAGIEPPIPEVEEVTDAPAERRVPRFS